MNNEITNFNAEKSAEYVKDKYNQWKKRTVEIVKHLYWAKSFYNNSGFRTDLVPNGTRLNTFESYIDYIGISKRTVYNWLDRYEPKKQKLLTVEELKKAKEKEEKKRKEKMVNYKLTGVKSNDWTKKDDTEYKKYYDEEERDKRIKEEFKKMDNANYQKEQEKTNSRIANEELTKALEIEAKRIDMYKKFETDGTLSGVFDIINSYLTVIKNESSQIEACQNIIKFCRNKSIEYQASK